MIRRFRTRVTWAVAAGLSLFSSGASSAVVQAAQGQQFFGVGEFTVRTITQTTDFRILDGRRVVLAVNGTRTWVTPWASTKGGMTVTAYWSGSRSHSLAAGTMLRTRLCSFDSDGVFYACSQWNMPTSPAGFIRGVASVYVPIGGSVYAQTEMGRNSTSQTVTLSHVEFL